MTDNNHDVDIYRFPDGKITEPITPEEAAKLGFCPGCGYFVAGSEADDVSMGEFGLCYECVEELKIEMEESELAELQNAYILEWANSGFSEAVFGTYDIPPSHVFNEDDDSDADKLPF